MRVKSDARREAILDIAKDLFREVGYERASMAMISARVGGSKATLYSYFKSKEALFAAAMIAAMEEQAQGLLDLLNPAEPDLRTVLVRFGHAYLALVTSADALAITRTAIAEGTNSGLGAELYELGPRRGMLAVEDYMRGLVERGTLRPCDPRVASAHLKGLLEAGMVEPLLFGAPIEFALDAAVEEAIDAFLRAYLAAADAS